jgi:excisionase family DNA binding protein
MTIEKAALFLKLSAQGLRGWISRQEIPHTRLGNKSIRLRSHDLEQLIEASFVPAIPRSDTATQAALQVPSIQ